MRPLMPHGVGQLEELFAKSKGDTKVLKQLEHELQYRQVPRAVALLAEVQAAMYGANETAAPVPGPAPLAPARQPGLWTESATPPTAPPDAVRLERAPAPIPVAVSSPAAAPQHPRAVLAMTVEDACKLLKATPSATWESIERTRRLLVQQSSPPRTATMSAEKRAQVLEETDRVNVAYATLSQARQRGR